MKYLPCARVCAGDGEYNSEPDKFHPIRDTDLKKRMEIYPGNCNAEVFS